MVARKREQDIEKERYGVNALEAESDRICAKLSAVERELDALAPLSLNAGAALLLMEFEYGGADFRVVLALRSMLPHLTGQIAKHAEAFLAASPEDDADEDEAA